MSYILKTVSHRGTELQFLQAFISAITEADGITCTTNDLAAQFSDTSNTPSFSLSINGIDTLTFVRSNSLASSVSSYKVVSANHTSETDGYEHTLAFESTYREYSDVVTRKWKFFLVGKGSAFYISFANHDSTAAAPYGYKWMFVRGSTKVGTAFSSPNGYLPMQSTFYSGKMACYNKVDRLPYNYTPSNPNSIETIHNKVFLDTSNTDMEFLTTALWDCSKIAPYTTIVIDDKSYYSLGEHTLLEE